MNGLENTTGEWEKLQVFVKTHTSLSICIPVGASIDTFAAATSLYLGLLKLGKQVSLVASQPASLSIPLTALDKIQHSLSSDGNNLIISFPYTEGAIDKVTYNIEGEQFNLIIQPRSSQHKLDVSHVRYSYTGGAVEGIFTIDTPQLELLGPLYKNSHEEFKGKSLMNIDRHVTNSRFGTINIVERTFSSTSEIILKLLQLLGVEITKEIATNLFIGIRSATVHFTSYTVNAHTFEAASLLLKYGAVKKAPVTNVMSPMIQDNSLNSPSMNEAVSFPEEDIEAKENPLDETPQDWLKPKVFKGSQLI